MSKDVTRKKSLSKSKIVLETPTALLELFVAIFVPCILDFHFDVSIRFGIWKDGKLFSDLKLPSFIEDVICPESYVVGLRIACLMSTKSSHKEQ